MRDCRANTRNIWYAIPEKAPYETDDSGDYTGEYKKIYGKVASKRMNLSPWRGSVHDDYFGATLDYTATLSTSDMSLAIVENTLIWDEAPELADGKADSKTAKYVVVAVAKGKYGIHYALRLLNREVG